MAYSLAYGYRRFRNSVTLIDGHAVERRDAVIAINSAPYSRESMQVVDAARSAGARVVAFTDSRASPLALAADVSFLFTADSPSFFPSVTAAVAAAETPLEVLVVRRGRRNRFQDRSR